MELQLQIKIKYTGHGLKTVLILSFVIYPFYHFERDFNFSTPKFNKYNYIIINIVQLQSLHVNTIMKHKHRYTT